MKKFTIIGILTTSLALAAAPTMARDYDRGKQFSSDHHRYEHRDYRKDKHYDRRDYRKDRRYEKRHYSDDRHHYQRFSYSDRYHDVKHHRKHYRCGYHPGSHARHSHHHYYDRRTGEYLAIIGGTILLTEILTGHH